MMSTGEYEELYLASVRVPLVLAFFLGLWGLVILILQALQIDFSAVLRKASGTSNKRASKVKVFPFFSQGLSACCERATALCCHAYCYARFW